jgi:hypothetical protein
MNGRIVEFREEKGVDWAIIETSKGRKREFILVPKEHGFEIGDRIKAKGWPLHLEPR